MTLLYDSLFGALSNVQQVAAYRFQDLETPKPYGGWRNLNEGGLTLLFGSRAELAIPCIHLPSFGKDGIRGIEGDPLYGMMDQGPLELLVGLVAVQKPTRVLVVGSGMGILPLLIHQTLMACYDARGKERVPLVVAVELGEETPSFALSPRQEMYRKGKPHEILVEGMERHVIKRWTDHAIDADDPMWFNNDPVGLQMVTADSFAYLSEQVADKSTEKYDLIVVDGSHDRDATTADLLLSWELLSKDGIIFVDDVGKPTNTGVDTAVHLLAFRNGTHPFLVSEPDTGFAPKCALFFKALSQSWAFDERVANLLK